MHVTETIAYGAWGGKSECLLQFLAGIEDALPGFHHSHDHFATNIQERKVQGFNVQLTAD